MLLLPQCCAWPQSCPSVPARGVDHRRSATMSNASLFCGTLEPTRMRWECGQVRVTRLGKGSNCAGVQRCQVCAPINMASARVRYLRRSVAKLLEVSSTGRRCFTTLLAIAGEIIDITPATAMPSSPGFDFDFDFRPSNYRLRL